MSEKNGSNPFHQLGTVLKQTRQKRQESLAEVSGAVEIDVDMLSEIEKGIQCPCEEVLLLLISHFGVKEDEATKLWELAGFDQQDTPATHLVNDLDGQAKQMVVVMPADSRITYTDKVHVMMNSYGLVMNFMQTDGTGKQPITVARMGMSKEHARSVLEVLQKTLQQVEQPNEIKALPAPKTRSHKRSKE